MARAYAFKRLLAATGFAAGQFSGAQWVQGWTLLHVSRSAATGTTFADTKSCSGPGLPGFGKAGEC